MKLLWLVNTIFPALAQSCGLPAEKSGGWLTAQAAFLARDSHVELLVVTTRPGRAPVHRHRSGGIGYALVYADTLAEKEARFRALLAEAAPDIVHIHGTEYQHSLAMLHVCDKTRCLVSIQGLTHLCAPRFFAGMPERYRRAGALKAAVRRCLPVRGGVLAWEHRQMERSGEEEKRLLRAACHVAGRTAWDRRGVLDVNPALIYHHCGEILRPAFYAAAWQPAHCRRHRIFMSQGNYPLKGLHIALRQLPSVIKQYPGARLVVAGQAPRAYQNPLKRALADYLYEYQAYCKRLITALHLENHVFFTGPLDEDAMCAEYQKAQVFLCASSVENSPNSVAEAMLLGLPVVASRVGGIPDMIAHEKEGLLYPFEKPQRLAEEVCRVFADDALAQNLGADARVRALARHDPHRITNDLLCLYQSLLTGAH